MPDDLEAFAQNAALNSTDSTSLIYAAGAASRLSSVNIEELQQTRLWNWVLQSFGQQAGLRVWIKPISGYGGYGDRNSSMMLSVEN